MSQPGRGDSYDDVQDEPEELVESESETDDENYEPPQNDKPHNQSFSEGYLGSLDDDALFDMLKKSVCISLRHLISEAARCEGTSSSLPSGVGKATHPNSRGAAPKATTRLNVSYFSEVLVLKQRRGGYPHPLQVLTMNMAILRLLNARCPAVHHFHQNQ